MIVKDDFNQLNAATSIFFKKLVVNLLILSCMFWGTNASDYVDSGQSSRMRIYMQDEIALNGETTIISIPHMVEYGPSSMNAYIAPINKQVGSTGRGDFLYDPNSNPDEFVSVNAFTVADTVLTLYDQDVNFFKAKAINTKSFDRSYQSWQKRYPLAIYPEDDSSENNAFFVPTSKSSGELHFFPFESPTKGRVYTSNSFDIVAHETGHAALYYLRPDLNYGSPQTAAFNESFGDLTAIFTILSLPTFRSELLAETRGDLYNKSFLPLLAEEFGIALHQGKALREADNILTVRDLDPAINPEFWEQHSLSRLFTGTIYDVLADTFNSKSRKDDTSLTSVGDNLRRLMLLSIIETPYDNPTFASIGATMYNLSLKYNVFNFLNPYIETNFLKRGITIRDFQKDLSSQDAIYLASLRTSQETYVPHICKSLKMKKERRKSYTSALAAVEDLFIVDNLLSSLNIHAESDLSFSRGHDSRLSQYDQIRTETYPRQIHKKDRGATPSLNKNGTATIIFSSKKVNKEDASHFSKKSKSRIKQIVPYTRNNLSHFLHFLKYTNEYNYLTIAESISQSSGISNAALGQLERNPNYRPTVDYENLWSDLKRFYRIEFKEFRKTN